MLEDRVGGVDGHLVVGGVAVREPEVVVLDREVEVGEDELLLDLGPDDAEGRERREVRFFFQFFFFVFEVRFSGAGEKQRHIISLVSSHRNFLLTGSSRRRRGRRPGWRP